MNFNWTLLAVYTTDHPVAKPGVLLNVPLTVPPVPADFIMSMLVPSAGVSEFIVIANVPETVITADAVEDII